MVNILIAIGAALICGIAEYIHFLKCRKLKSLAFGPEGKPAGWVGTVPVLRSLAVGMLTWSLIILMNYQDPAGLDTGDGEKPTEDQIKHVLVVYDCSPSMEVTDAGSDGTKMRKERAKEVLESMMERITSPFVRYSMVAFFTEARPIVVKSEDRDVILNMMDLSLHHGFTPGKTKLMDGVHAALELCKKWKPESTTIIMVTDGDTVPTAKSLRLPASVSNFIVAGIGSSRGSYIDGHQSRQDASSLRTVASKVSGIYHDANVKQISTNTMGNLAGDQASKSDPVNEKFIALILCGIGAFLLTLLPILLDYFGFDTHKNKTLKRELKNAKGAA